MPSSRQCPPTGHVSFFLQLHVLFSSALLLRSWLLWLLMALSMLGMHLGDTFRVFLLKIFLSWWSGGKCLSTSNRNFLEMFVSIVWLNGGLNQVIFHLLFFRCVGSSMQISSRTQNTKNTAKNGFK